MEARIATAINRLGRQVEKDRAEQQLIVGMLDYLREWLAFALPAVADKSVAKEIQRERTEVFFRDLHLMMVSQGKAKITAYMAAKDTTATECPTCGTGLLKCEEGQRGLFCYCTNWDATPKCDGRYEDTGGRPKLTASAVA